MSEDNGNGHVHVIQSTTCTPFCLKNADGIIVHKFDDLGVPRKIERDDIQLIVTINPDSNGRERKFFFPIGPQGIEIIYGRRSIDRGPRNGRF